MKAKEFGEIKTIKIATEINNNDWHDFIKNLKSFDGNKYQFKEQKKYHFDIL